MATQARQLWTKWREGRDESAFEALVRPELPALYDVARRVGLPNSDAEDVVQDALAALANERSPRPGDVGVGAWLMRSVRLRALSARRSAGRRRQRETRALRDRNAPWPALDLRDEIENALGGLPEDARQVLLFRFVYDLDYREIAYVLGVTENACRIRVHRASGRLRERLGPRASAMLAAVPLPDLPGSAKVIAMATHAGSATTGLGLIGAFIMGTTAKMVVTAVAAAALTAGAFLTFGGPAADTSDPLADGSVDDVALLDGTPSGSGEGEPHLEGQDRVLRSALADLEPTDAELTRLRTFLVEERARAEAAVMRPSDSGLAVLTRVFENGMDPWLAMNESAAFRARVRSSPDRAVTVDTPRGEVTEVSLAKLGSKVIEFGPGTFKVSTGRLKVRDALPHFEIRGAGMDETTLLLDRRLMITGAIEHLQVQDLTLDLGGAASLFDVRGRIAAAFERVRFKDVRGEALNLGGQAYVSCVSCEFLKADGGSGARVATLRGPALLVLEKCAFIGLADVQYTFKDAAGSRIRLLDCTFEETRLADSRILGDDEQPLAEIRVEGGQATYGPRNWTDEERSKRWGAPFAKITDFSLLPTIRLLTLRRLVEILRTVEFPRDEMLYSIMLAGWGHHGPAAFRASTHKAGRARPAVWNLLLVDGTWTAKRNPSGGGMGYFVWSDLPPPLDILGALERAEAPDDMLVPALSLTRYGSEGQPKERRLNFYELGQGSEAIVIDAATGEKMTRDELNKR